MNEQESPATGFEQITWPLSRLGEALGELARRSGFIAEAVAIPAPPALSIDAAEGALGHWIEAAANQLTLDAEPVQARYDEVLSMVRHAAPALFRLPGEGEPVFLALLRAERDSVTLLGPERTLHRQPLARVRDALCRHLEEPLHDQIDRMLAEAGTPPRRRAKARKALLDQRLGQMPVGEGWLLRLPPHADIWRQIRHSLLPRRLLLFVGGHALQYALWLLAWWIIGQGALQGRLERGWLWAWALLLLTLIPLRLLVVRTQGLIGVEAGTLLKQRLLYGALRLDPAAVRHQGLGQFLGRVIESESLETVALSGGFLGVVAVVELILAGGVLAAGAGGWFHALLLLGWVALVCVVTWQFYRYRRRWTDARLSMTHDLVERMVGHRTRLAQQEPGQWHTEEDSALARYLSLSQNMDRSIAVRLALIPRGWLLLGLLGLAPAFVAGGDPAALAVALGGVLLAYQALRKLSPSLWFLSGVAIGWQQVAPLWKAAARPPDAGTDALLLSQNQDIGTNGTQPLLDAHNLVFRYRERSEPILRGCSLQICAGDRLLLQGPSGSGKTTLAALLTGLRRPDSGLLLLHGLDRQTLGLDGWRRRVASAPQFHENHILAETFAFNLLMGRRWPPTASDLAEAEAICHALGLGDLLARMPAGMMQMVGETGWQLSHGERSRLYVARALLQGADLIVLDESFAALDPENLQRALRCVLERAPSVLVIAHP